ncbi:MAG: SDR family NAD(P)-dependent oxidoreductase [Bacteroidota bacterium]
MPDKTVIITGANSGIGKEASLKFAEAGYTVVMACRNLEKSKPVKEEVVERSKNDKVLLEELDMSSFASIENFSDQIKTHFSKLDILINNAAYFNHGESYRLSADNTEITFATNVAGPFLLTTLLSPLLKKSDDARVLNASSNIIKHFFSPKKMLTLNNIKGITDNQYKHSVYSSYCNSKMALLMLTFKMAGLYQNSGIKFYSLQINGARMSDETLKKFTPGWRFVAIIQNLFFPPPEFMGSNYFKICTEKRFSKYSGIHLNHKLQIMKAAPENPGLNHSWGIECYPALACNMAVQEKILKICKTLTANYTGNYTERTL